MKGRNLLFACVGVALLACLFVIARRVAVQGRATSDLSLTPYVANRHLFSVVNGVEKTTDLQVLSRRRDGAEARISLRKLPDGRLLVLRTVLLPSGVLTAAVDPFNLKSSELRSPETTAHWRDRLAHPPSGCLQDNKEHAEGEETLHGVLLYKVVRQDAKTRTIFWRARDFACEVLQYGVEEKGPDGQWATKFGSRLDAVAQSAHDKASFEIASSYVEATPSEISHKVSVAQGATPENCPECFGPDPADVGYRRNHLRLLRQPQNSQ